MVDKYLDDPRDLSKRKRTKVKKHIDSGNVDIMAKVDAVNTLGERETQLKKASGFTQKGWSGYQQKKK